MMKIQSKEPASSQLDRSQRKTISLPGALIDLNRKLNFTAWVHGSSHLLQRYNLKSDGLFSKVTSKEKENGIVLVVETSIEQKFEASGFRATESILSITECDEYIQIFEYSNILVTNIYSFILIFLLRIYSDTSSYQVCLF